MEVTFGHLLWKKIDGLCIVDVDDRIPNERIRGVKQPRPGPKFAYDETRKEDADEEDYSFSKQAVKLQRSLHLESHMVFRHIRYLREKALGRIVKAKSAPPVTWRGSEYLLSFFKQVDFSSHELTRLDSGLSELINLSELDVSHNDLELVDNLPNKISILQAYDNHITDVFLPSPSTVLHLGLGYNKITHLNQLRQARESLLSLDLSFNNITDLEHVVSELKSFTSLRHLFLIGNPICLLPHYYKAIREAVPTLTLLDGVKTKKIYDDDAEAAEQKRESEKEESSAEDADKADEKSGKGEGVDEIQSGEGKHGSDGAQELSTGIASTASFSIAIKTISSIPENLLEYTAPEPPEGYQTDVTSEFLAIVRLGNGDLFETKAMVHNPEEGDIEFQEERRTEFKPDLRWYRYFAVLGIDITLVRKDTITTSLVPEEEGKNDEEEKKEEEAPKVETQHTVIGIGHVSTTKWLDPTVTKIGEDVVEEFEVESKPPSKEFASKKDLWDYKNEWHFPVMLWSKEQVRAWVGKSPIISLQTAEIRKHLESYVKFHGLDGKSLIATVSEREDEDERRELKKALKKDYKMGVISTAEKKVFNTAVKELLKDPTVLAKEVSEEKGMGPKVKVTVSLNHKGKLIVAPPPNDNDVATEK